MFLQMGTHIVCQLSLKLDRNMGPVRLSIQISGNLNENKRVWSMSVLPWVQVTPHYIID